MTEIKQLRDRIDTWNHLKADSEALDDVLRMAKEEDDESMEADIRASFKDISAASIRRRSWSCFPARPTDQGHS